MVQVNVFVTDRQMNEFQCPLLLQKCSEQLKKEYQNMTLNPHGKAWPLTYTELIINRDHLLIIGYLPTKFEASGGKVLLSYP